MDFEDPDMLAYIEDRWAKRDEARARTDKWLEDREKERLSKPLVERLRNCGPYIDSDGHMSLTVGSYKDAHEAADRIEELERQLNKLNNNEQKE